MNAGLVTCDTAYSRRECAEKDHPIAVDRLLSSKEIGLVEKKYWRDTDCIFRTVTKEARTAKVIRADQAFVRRQRDVSSLVQSCRDRRSCGLLACSLIRPANQARGYGGHATLVTCSSMFTGYSKMLRRARALIACKQAPTVKPRVPFRFRRLCSGGIQRRIFPVRLRSGADLRDVRVTPGRRGRHEATR